MEEFFGIRFLATEYSITNGRMDSIGIDENNCPVIFEYKRSSSENIINQGLFYLDWLLDHKADFQLLVMNTLGKEAAKEIDWSAPCVFCIAKEFTKFDEHAVNQMQRNIKLVKYNKYGENLILFEHINVPILKNHGGAKMTISMKNHMGIVWDRGFFHRNDLQQCIADICTISKPAVLNVVDAYRLMKTNGPRGKSEADVVLAKGVFMSPDIVAVDTAATKFFNQAVSYTHLTLPTKLEV